MERLLGVHVPWWRNDNVPNVLKFWFRSYTATDFRGASAMDFRGPPLGINKNRGAVVIDAAGVALNDKQTCLLKLVVISADGSV